MTFKNYITKNEIDIKDIKIEEEKYKVENNQINDITEETKKKIVSDRAFPITRAILKHNWN